MGRSPASSCLRIIACAGGDDAAEPTAVENKSSGDKRGWSFRKKSGKQRGLVTSVVSETTPASRTRETLESALLQSPSPDNNNVSEKQQSFSVQSIDEKKSQLPVVTYVADEPVDEKKKQSAEDKTELSALCLKEQIEHKTELPPVLVESKGTETEGDHLFKTDTKVNLEGPNSAIASVIAEDITSEAENASKVEQEESETSDVIIIKKESDEEVNEKLDESVVVIIQAAIRGFLARRELLRRKKVVKLQAAVRGHLVRSQAMGSLRCVQAIVKMQAMVRARHSMKSGSHVSVISEKAETNASAQKLLENKFAKHLMESTPKTKPISIKCDPTKPSSAWNWLERWMSVPKPEKTSIADSATEEQQLEETQNIKVSPQVDFVNSDSMVETKIETGFSSYEASKVEAPCAVLSETEKMSQYDSPEASAEVDRDLIQSHTPTAKETDSLLEDPEYVDEPKHSLKRKASNPSFIAAQSKFEELTSSTGSNKEMTLSSKDDVLGEEGKTNIDSPVPDTTKTRKVHSLQNVASAELSGSECGTELSVTSSLDTLEKKSDGEGGDPKVEAKLLENGTFKTEDQAELIEIDVKEKTSLSTVEDPKEKVENVKDGAEISTIQHDSVISTPESKKRRAEDESGPQACQLSEGALTPMTITESQTTPASQASSSVKARKGKSEKSGSSQKRKVSKKITSSPKQETGTGEVNNTAEQEEGKEQKSGRRNSFGFDQEARESSGGKNSLPRFMQPTQSAKAKVQENNSPRSSPDLQDRDVVSVKKRHSLPGVTNGKQGSSPRIQRSVSQAQQGTKDRKWQR